MKYIVLLATLFFGFVCHADDPRPLISLFNITLECMTTQFETKPKSIKEAIRMAHDKVQKSHLGEDSLDLSAQAWANLGGSALNFSLMCYEMSQKNEKYESVSLDNNLLMVLAFIEQSHHRNGFFSTLVSQLK